MINSYNEIYYAIKFDICIFLAKGEGTGRACDGSKNIYLYMSNMIICKNVLPVGTRSKTFFFVLYKT